MKYRTDCKMYSLVNMGNPGGVPHCSIKGLEPDCQNCQRPSNTNVDILHTMTDEQFAHWLVERVTDSPWCKPDAPVDPETKRCQIWDCEKCALDWLRQEAEQCTK